MWEGSEFDIPNADVKKLAYNGFFVNAAKPILPRKKAFSSETGRLPANFLSRVRNSAFFSGPPSQLGNIDPMHSRKATRFKFAKLASNLNDGLVGLKTMAIANDPIPAPIFPLNNQTSGAFQTKTSYTILAAGKVRRCSADQSNI